MKFSFHDTRITPEQYQSYREKLSSYRAYLQKIVEQREDGSPESSLCLPSDDALRGRIIQLVKTKASHVKLVIVVGIGGSNLGTEAIYRAQKNTEHAEMFFLETTDEQSLVAIRGLLKELSSPEEVIVSVISKSGGTIETIANADMLAHCMSERFGEEGARNRFVVITNKDSELWKTAMARDMSVLEIPFAVGGRYSVLSAVGLFPLACAGFDIEELHRGAVAIRTACLGEESPAILSAAFLVHYYNEGYNIHDTFFFDPSLEKLGMWYRQLLAESIGKTTNNHGDEVRVGITPTVSIGSRDLHSVFQLTLGGPRDKTATFVTTTADQNTFTVPSDGLFSSSQKNLVGKSSKDILDALTAGAKGAYRESHVPFIETFFSGERVSLFELGEFLQWKMIEIMFVAHLFEINAFNQDAIESYKKITHRALEGGE
ncbi:MAG: hypothetical protein WDZ74_02545 [Candidatus Paceibacterota bacterium]